MKYPEPKYVEMGTCTAGAIVGWLNDYAKFAKQSGLLPEGDIEQITSIASWRFDKAEKVDRENGDC
jgi:hypothetical protein